MSLQELSRLSGVSVGTLSQVERDRANPSLRVLTKIKAALGAQAGDLFNETGTALEDPSFVRRRDRRPFCDLGYLTKELLSAGTGHALEIMILHVPPHGSSGDQPLTSPTEKGGLILEGALMLNVGDKTATLHEGDSFVFDGQNPHSFRNPSGQPAKVLWIINNIPVERRL